ECAQPGKDGFDQVLGVGALLAAVAPAAGIAVEVLKIFWQASLVDRWLAGGDAVTVQVFQPFAKEKVSDLFYGHPWIGEAGGPETVPEFVNILAQMGGEHEVSS